MPMKWDDVREDKAFRALSKAQQENVRAMYFDEVVVPQIPPDEVAAYRKKFDEDTGPGVVNTVRDMAGDAWKYIKGGDAPAVAQSTQPAASGITRRGANGTWDAPKTPEVTWHEEVGNQPREIAADGSILDVPGPIIGRGITRAPVGTPTLDRLKGRNRIDQAGEAEAAVRSPGVVASGHAADYLKLNQREADLRAVEAAKQGERAAVAGEIQDDAESLNARVQSGEYLPVDTRTGGQRASDTSRGVAEGAANVGKMVGDIYGLTFNDMDNWLSNAGGDAAKYWKAGMSDYQKQRDDMGHKRVAAIEDQGGFWSGLSAAVENAADDPVMSLARQLPQLVVSGGAGMAVKAGAKQLLKNATERALIEVGTAGGVAAGAAMQGADIGADAYEEAYSILVKRGVPKEEASAQAIMLGRVAAAKAAAISIVVNRAVPFGDSMERVFAGGLKSGGIKGALTGVVKAGAGETISEGAEEGLGKKFQNESVQVVDPSISTMRGVGAATGEGAFLGGIMGGAAGGIGGFRRAEHESTVNPDIQMPGAAPITTPPNAAGVQTQGAPQPEVSSAPIADPFERIATLELMEAQGGLTPELSAELDGLVASVQSQPAASPATETNGITRDNAAIGEAIRNTPASPAPHADLGEAIHAASTETSAPAQIVPEVGVLSRAANAGAADAAMRADMPTDAIDASFVLGNVEEDAASPVENMEVTDGAGNQGGQAAEVATPGDQVRGADLPAGGRGIQDTASGELAGDGGRTGTPARSDGLGVAAGNQSAEPGDVAAQSTPVSSAEAVIEAPAMRQPDSAQPITKPLTGEPVATQPSQPDEEANQAPIQEGTQAGGTKEGDPFSWDTLYPNIKSAQAEIKKRKLKDVGVFVQGDRYRIGAKASRNRAESNNLIARIKQLGGIHTRYRSDVIGDKSGAPGLFSNSGKGLDDLATQLRADGFDIDTDTVDGGVEALTNLLQRATIGGDTILNHTGMMDRIQAEENANYRENLRDDITGLGGETRPNMSTKQLESLREKLRAEQEKLRAEIDEKARADAALVSELIGSRLTDAEWAMLMDEAASQEFAYDQDIGAVMAREQEREEQNAIGRRYQEEGAKAPEPAPERGSGQDHPVGGSQPGAAQGQQRDRQPESQAFDLTGQTPEDIKAEEDARAENAKKDADEAIAREAAEKKKRVAAEVAARQQASAENFQLGQSAEDALAGQGDVFSQPAKAKNAQKQNQADARNEGGQAGAVSRAQEAQHIQNAGVQAEAVAPVQPKGKAQDKVGDGAGVAAGNAVSEVGGKPAAKPAKPTQEVAQDDAYRIQTRQTHDDLFARLRDGKATLEEFKSSFPQLVANEDAIKADLGSLTKDGLFKEFPGLQYRYKNEKKSALVDAAYDDMLTNYTLGKGVSFAMDFSGSYRNKRNAAIQNLVDNTTQDELNDYAAKIASQRGERMAQVEKAIEAVKDPQTLEDFIISIRAMKDSGKTYQEARMSLTPVQRAKFDELAGEQTRGERKARADQQKTEISAPSEAVGASEIIKTKHTKYGHDLWQFTLERRVPPDEFKSLVSQAKRLGGDYSSYRGNGAIPGWQFRTEDAAAAFRKLVSGDATAAQEVAQARRDAFAEDRGQSAVERLSEMADRLEERANESLGRDRKANTNRRARFAASAEAAASADKALAKTMRNIADAIQNGTTKFLDRVRQKSQVEMLREFVRDAQYEEGRAKYPSYLEQEKHKGEPPTNETADFAKFPSYTASRSDLASIGRQLSEKDGAKKTGASLLKVADDVTAEYIKYAKENLSRVTGFSGSDGAPAIFASKDQAEAAIARSGFKGKAIVLPFKRGQNIIIHSPSAAKEKGIWQGDGDKRITLSPDFAQELIEKARANKIDLPWVFDSAQDKLKRLKAMGIENPQEFRAMLREFIALREAPKEADKIKEMERAMIGRRNDGLDFFPTPAGVVQSMIDAAELEAGMNVLEPSAGMGHIAEGIRAAGVDPDVVEMSNDRLELLEAKGFDVVGRDFMDMNPRGFTYGDVFQYKDGRKGVMRGSGGMGSGRVGFIPEGKTERESEWVDREDLTGIEKTGYNSGYDRILMNPPFSDRRDIEHVRHAYELLRPGGRLVAIMGEGSFFGSDKKATEFRDWLESMGGTSEKLEDGTFLDPSLPVNTGVAARMVVIDKAETSGTRLSRANNTITVDRKERTENRKEFLEGSKIRHVVYHATKGDFSVFDTTGRSDLGAHFGTIEQANNVLMNRLGGEGSVMPVWLSLKRPLRLKDVGSFHADGIADQLERKGLLPKGEGRKIIKEIDADWTLRKKYDPMLRQIIKNAGYDGIVYANTAPGEGSGDSYIAFDPTQIKSATGNIGTFDASSANILFSRQSGAGIPLRDAQAVVDAFRKVNRNAPTIILHDDVNKAPETLLSDIRQAGAESDVEGAYHEGVIHLFPQHVSSPERLADVLVHEGRHFALHAMRGKGLDSLLLDIHNTNDRVRMAARKKQRALGIKSVVEATEEVLADMDVNTLRGLKGWPKFVAFIRFRMRVFAGALRRAGLHSVADYIQGKIDGWTDADIALLLTNADKFVRSGSGYGAGDTRLQRAGLQSEYEIQPDATRNTPIDGAELKALRRAAAGIESPERGITFRVDEEGRAIVTGPARAKVPARFQQFATDHGLTLVIRRGNTDAVMPGNKGMPIEYRESGALYFGEIGNGPGQGGAWLDRTGNTRFSRASQTPLPGVATTPPAQPPVQATATLQGGASGKPAWDAPEKSWFDDKLYLLQDKHIDMKRVIHGIKTSGAKIADKFDTYLQEELFHGRAAKRTLDFVDRELTPLLKDAEARRLNLEDIDAYLHARHAKEANELIRQRDPQMQDGGSGMMDAEADAYMAGLSPGKKADLAAVAKKIDAILAVTRGLYASYGLESRDTVNEWAAMFKHYVPLMREDHDGGMGIGQGFSIKGRETRHRTGSTTAKVVDILANIALQREKVIVRGEKNRVAVSLVGLAKLNPNPEFWSVDRPKRERVLNEKTGLIEDRIDPRYKSAPNAVVAKIADGKGGVREMVLTFNEHDPRAMRMAESVKNLDAAQLNGAMALSAIVTRWIASVNTQYNPIFGIKNLVRDVGSAGLNLSSTELSGKKSEVLKHVPSALKGIYKDTRAERKGGMATSKWAQLWEEFTLEGGQTGYRDLYRTSADRAKSIDHALDPHQWMDSPLGKVFTVGGIMKAPWAVAQDKAGWLFDWLSDYNLAMENAVRLSAYKVGLEQGMSKQRAASLAKNLTVNFNRKGQAGQQAGALYAFFNASMQGTARMAETMLKSSPGDLRSVRLNGTGKKIVAGGVLLGAMNALMLAAAGFDDDEPPEFVRERNIIIPIGGKKYIAIPMPLGFHIIPNIGRVATEYAMNPKDGGKRLAYLVGSIFEAFNPIGSAGMSMQTIMPTPLDPFAALSENKDWTGKSIYKEDFSGLSPTPGHTRAKDTASGPSVALSHAFNWITGGDEYEAGEFSPSPDAIDYLIGQATGGVGRESLKLWQAGSSIASGEFEELPAHKIPLFGSFYGNSDHVSATTGRFYENMKRVNAKHGAYVGRIEDGNSSGASDYLEGNQIAKINANGYYTAVRNLRKARNMAVARGDKDGAKEISEKITDLMERFNDEVKERDSARD